MNCSHCDRANESDARFCAGCGAELGTASHGPLLEEEVIRIAQQQGKIAAIKFHRQQTGNGLRESKEAVEAILRQRGVELPVSGCFGMLLLVFVGLAFGCWLLT